MILVQRDIEMRAWADRGNDLFHWLFALRYTLYVMTYQTGVFRGRTIELESAVPEMEGQRVRVVLEPFEEQRLSNKQQRQFWKTWIEKGPDGPLEDGIDTELP